MSETERVPDYVSTLAAYHAAFAPELRAMVESLPIRPGDLVLDLACGDGTYTRGLAALAGPSGSVWGVDLARDYLGIARRAGPSGPAPERVAYSAASLERLPFAPATFDLAWCAQSFYSLDDPVDALKALARVVRPGGVVAVLESDTLHQVLLPWPIEVELALRGAELAGFAEGSRSAGKFYIGRRLRRVFEAAGLTDCRRRSWTIDRAAPLDPLTRTFLVEYLRELDRQAAPHLTSEMAAKVRPYLDPDSPGYLPARSDLEFTLVEHVVWGVSPGVATPP